MKGTGLSRRALSRVEVFLPVDDTDFLKSLPEQFIFGSFPGFLQVTDDSMLGDVGEHKANEAVGRIPAGTVELVGVVEVVAPFGGRAQLHDFFESLAAAWNRGIEPGVSFGLDVDERTERAFGGTVVTVGAFVDVHDVKGAAAAVRMPFGRTRVDMEFSPLLVLMVPHADTSGAKGRAIGVELDAAMVQEMGKGFLAFF